MANFLTVTPPLMLPWTHLQTQGPECLLLRTAARHESGQLTWRGRRAFVSVGASTQYLRLALTVPGRLFGIWFMKECGIGMAILALWPGVAHHQKDSSGSGQKGPGERDK